MSKTAFRPKCLYHRFILAQWLQGAPCIHKKYFNTPRNHVFSYAKSNSPKQRSKSEHRPNFSQLTAMMIHRCNLYLQELEWKKPSLARRSCLQNHLKNPSFFYGFLRVTTGFLRVSYGLENPGFFWKPGVLRVRTGFLRFTTGFLRVLNSTIKKPKKSIIFHRGEEIWPWDPQIPATNVGFLFKFNFKVRKRSLRGKVRKNASL